MSHFVEHRRPANFHCPNEWTILVGLFLGNYWQSSAREWDKLDGKRMEWFWFVCWFDPKRKGKKREGESIPPFSQNTRGSAAHGQGVNKQQKA
jgi:hypothetical protein